ncbi:hypothetical protein ACS0TY_003578 [Phlomoides rotata]
MAVPIFPHPCGSFFLWACSPTNQSIQGTNSCFCSCGRVLLPPLFCRSSEFDRVTEFSRVAPSRGIDFCHGSGFADFDSVAMFHGSH